MPEIKFTTGVQSLGREDIGAPAREAAAQIGVKDALVGGVLQLERAVSAAQYTKQMSEARNSIAELYDAVVSQESFMSSEIPEYVTGFERYEEKVGTDGSVTIVEKRIPASEIREEWFRQGLLNITNAAVKGSTAPTARSRISTELKASIGPAAYNQLLTYNRAAAKEERLAILDAAVQDGITKGDRIGVEAVLERGRLTGEISQADFEVRQLQASQDLDTEAYLQGIFNAEDESDLEELYSQLGNNESLTMPGESDMTPEQRRYLRQSIDRQEAVFDEARKERYADNDQIGMAMFLEGTLTNSWLKRMAITDGMSGSTIRALYNMLDSGGRGQDVRENIMAPFRRDIQRKMYTPEFGVQVSEIVREMRTGLMRSPVLNPKEVSVLVEYAQKVQLDLNTSPEIKTAVKNIRASVGLPIDEDAYQDAAGGYGPEMVLMRRAEADFKTALFAYIDEFGAEGNVLEFVERNKKNYIYTEDDDQKNRIKTRIENSRFKGYAAFSPLFDTNLTIRNAYKDFNRGTLSEEDMFDLWNMMYGDAIDIDLLENM